MKKATELLKKGWLCLWITSCLTSCETGPEPATEPVLPGNHGVFILNQGRYNANNASISYYNFETGELQLDMIGTDTEPLGSLGQDMLIYGSKLYVTVSSSSNIRVFDLNSHRPLKRIDVFDDNAIPRKPRYLTSYNGNIYASCSDGHAIRLDTASLTINGIVAVGEYPEGIAAYNEKLYVANSGGESEDGPHNTVSVIDLLTFKSEEPNRITVGLNPYILRSDGLGSIYLTYQGDFAAISGGFQKINTSDYSVQYLASSPKQDFIIENGFAYYFDVVYTLESTTDITYGKYDLNGKTVSSFISDTGAIKNIPYGIGINSYTKDFYIADSDWTNPGKVYIFNSEGKKINELNVGINPCKFAFY
ncbi:MAG: hypothetical protein FWF52_02265 [Candidatus Azobacteroides sp.]|nr:hypothetical protein [Candidatus Azobacteroides sp.]